MLRNVLVSAIILALFLSLSGFETLKASAAGELKWKYQTGGDVSSSPAIGTDGTIYFGSADSCLYALNPDGSLKWKYQTGYYSGYYITSSPAIGADGTIFFPSIQNNYTYFYSLNANGTLKWKYNIGWSEYAASSPAIGADGTIYVGSEDHYLYALNPDSTLKWKYRTGFNIYSSPAISADGTIYVGSYDGYLYALKPDGSLKWKKKGYYSNSSPAIGADGIIYVGSGNYLYALNPDSTLKWEYQTGDYVYSIYSSPAIGANGTIYVGSYYYLYALNPDGSLKWKYKTGDYVYSSPAVGTDGTIYVGSWDKYLYAFNQDGSLKWKYQTGDDVTSSPAIGVDGTIYVGSGDYYLYTFASGISSGLAASPWPKFRHNLQNTGQSQEINTLFLGDVNSDGLVDIFDILTIVRFALGQKTPTAQEKACADMNSDGTIDIFDVLACVNKALGKSLVLAGVTAADFSRINEKELEADLLSLGADKTLIADIFRLLDQQKPSPSLPKAFSLSQNAPNPFNPSTTISYCVPEGQTVQAILKVYDLRGRLVRTLVEEMREPGSYNVFWDGRDGKGQQISSGVYLYRMQAGEFVQTRKMVLLK